MPIPLLIPVEEMPCLILDFGFRILDWTMGAVDSVGPTTGNPKSQIENPK
jgi:hypothetical protein